MKNFNQFFRFDEINGYNTNFEEVIEAVQKFLNKLLLVGSHQPATTTLKKM